MRYLLFFSAIIVGVGWSALTPANATSLPEPGVSATKHIVTLVENVGYWRRPFRYGYVAPYAYYPPAYGYYPPAYGYYPPPVVYPPAVYGYRAAPPPVYAPPVYGGEAPAPAANPSAEEDYGNYPPAEEDYPAADGEYGTYPANGS
jgi:hypothetical protein